MGTKVRYHDDRTENQRGYAWRGFMLDVSRHFFSVDQIKRLLDRMKALDLNVFHWHLTDDQGWRLDLPGFPALTAVGAVRSRTQRTRGPFKRFDETEHRGFYSDSDVKAVLSHAETLGIEVVPEIDLPGHASALLAAYPDWGCGEKYEVPGTWGILHNILCIGDPETRSRVEALLEEVFVLFPGRYIHFGGDEVPLKSWKSCPRCRAHKEKMGYRRYRDLQGEFSQFLAEFALRRGKMPIFWNDALTETLPTEAIIQFWMGHRKSLKKASAEGRKVIISEYGRFYLDLSTRIVNSKKMKKFRPERIVGKAGLGSVIGIEAPLWTEWVPDFETVEDRLRGRLETFSEVACGG